MLACSSNSQKQDSTLVGVNQGYLQGSLEPNQSVVSFKGIPYATPPLAELRWQAPQPPKSWHGIKKAHFFGPKCMQNPLFSDMQFRDSGNSEDCLFLNIWTPSQTRSAVPVLVYFYGGGFVAGDGSEKRYDGSKMATQGIITVTVNYRMGVFGFFAHPQLSRDSGYGGSGNYGLLDQHAALLWVQENIAAFGGDPSRVTIAGESAGSMSVSAHMASPLSKNLMAGVIGQSGSLMYGRQATLAKSEAQGVLMADSVLQQNSLSGQEVLEQLRQIPAQTLLDKITVEGFDRFKPTIDGYFLPKSVFEFYTKGEYHKVPLLAGVNSEESSYRYILNELPANLKNYKTALQQKYPDTHQQMFDIYPATDSESVKDAAQALASDAFISLSAWNWMSAVSQTNPAETFYYEYAHPRPIMRAEFAGDNLQTNSRGATHSAEIEYALGNLDVNNIYQWQEEDYQVSKLLQQYFVNFIQQGNPNGQDLPNWPIFNRGKQMVISVKAEAEDIEYLYKRYEALNTLNLGN
jgi:para-nitrobenzyl esterase